MRYGRVLKSGQKIKERRFYPIKSMLMRRTYSTSFS